MHSSAIKLVLYYIRIFEIEYCVFLNTYKCNNEVLTKLEFHISIQMVNIVWTFVLFQHFFVALHLKRIKIHGKPQISKKCVVKDYKTEL